MIDSLQTWSQPLRDAAYDNTNAVLNSAAQLADFDVRSADLVRRIPAQLDLIYGAADRLRFDFFKGDSGKPTLLFIHGGYWQMRHKNTFRFVVEGALEHGVSSALIGYTLAPQASLMRIVQEVQRGIAAVRAHALEHGGDGTILLCGWSAGAHLTAMGLECDGVIAGLGISGIYDLAPLQATKLNRALQLTPEEIETLSPLRLPLVAKPFITAYGTAELPQLQAQSETFARYRGATSADVQAVQGADHFSILNSLAARDGSLLKRFLELAKQA